MARYIDADRFKSNLEKAMEKMHVINGIHAVGLEAVIESLDRQPTADVVPRSEVEKLEEHIDDLNDSKEHLCVMLEEARADVAREIFEEIEKIIDSHEITIGLVYDEGAGATTAIDRIHKKIAELKKKYTEGE